MTRRVRLGALLLAWSLPLATFSTHVSAQEVTAPAGETGLVPVRTEAAKGRILVTLPAPAQDGVSLRLLYSTALRTGLGSAPLGLDRGRIGNTQLLAFRRIGGKIAVQFENPRFRASNGEPAQKSAVASDFGISTVWRQRWIKRSKEAKSPAQALVTSGTNCCSIRVSMLFLRQELVDLIQ